MDTYVVAMSDMHSGSSKALFPRAFMQFEHTNYTPTKEQKRMYEHWIKCAKYVAKNRVGKKIIIVHNGDAIDGIHHGTHQIVSHKWQDHVTIHLELMDEFLREVGFGDGDELHYVSGTESHTQDYEREIANDLSAGYHDELKMKINGVKIWFTHHGGAPGKGTNVGDGYRNFLKTIYWECLQKNKEMPDIVVSSHYHRPIYSTYVQDYLTIHGIILPSWQMKTRYAYMVAPFQVNQIGMSFIDITEQGFIKVHKPLLLELQNKK